MIQNLRGNPRVAALGLLSVAMVWGATFVMTQHAVADYPVFAFLGWRFLIASCAFTLIFIKPLGSALRELHRPSLYTALGAGLFLALGYIFQTFGMIPAQLGGTTPARTAFITGLFVVFVPVGQFLLTRTRPQASVWLGVLFAVAGLWFLSGLGASPTREAGSGWVWGDSMVFICSLAYTVHMLILGRSDDSYSTVLLTFVQLLVVMGVCAAMSVITGEQAPAPRGAQLWYALIICGVFASAYAFAIQTWAQQIMPPSQVALILIMEPAFGGLFGWLAAGAVFVRELIGAALMMCAMFFAELPGTTRQRTEPSLEGPPVLIDQSD